MQIFGCSRLKRTVHGLLQGSEVSSVGILALHEGILPAYTVHVVGRSHGVMVELRCFCYMTSLILARCNNEVGASCATRFGAN